MRGTDSYNENLFTTVCLEEFVSANHPLRPIRAWVNEALAAMGARLSAMYEVDIKGARPSIAPEKLMRAMLLQVLYRVRSERQRRGPTICSSGANASRASYAASAWRRKPRDDRLEELSARPPAQPYTRRSNAAWSLACARPRGATRNATHAALRYRDREIGAETFKPDKNPSAERTWAMPMTWRKATPSIANSPAIFAASWPICPCRLRDGSQ